MNGWRNRVSKMIINSYCRETDDGESREGIFY